MGSKSISLPELGEGVTEGELIKWLVSEGESIQTDQPVAEVMTDKASMEVPSPFDGMVQSLLAKEGEAIQVGQEILKLSSCEEEKGAVTEKAEKVAESKSSFQINSIISPREEEKGAVTEKAEKAAEYSNEFQINDFVNNDKVLATPFTRRLARELAVDISRIQGSGLAGRVTKEDILHHSSHEGGKKITKEKVTKFEYKEALSHGSFIGFSILREGRQERQPLKGVRKKNSGKNADFKNSYSSLYFIGIGGSGTVG